MSDRQFYNSFQQHRHSKAQTSGKLFSQLSKSDIEQRELVDFFVSEMQIHIAEMQYARDRNDLETIRKHAHQLKGAGAGFGFPLISELSTQVDALIKANVSGAQLDQAIENLMQNCRRVTAWPANELKET